ncbi:MAG: DinB family protein [Saprospiraceae bacterium]|nr:DinB family protein [Saprospiraceae bacterium]
MIDTTLLHKTPVILRSMLSDLSDDLIFSNEGGESWSPFDIVGHLIHGEKTDWIPRTEIILSDDKDKNFIPFDRFAQFENSKGKTLPMLLDEFESLRAANLKTLSSLNLSPLEYQKTGIHPEFGEVSLQQLISCWVAHDLGHIYQISRVLAFQYKNDVGPWVKYLRILQ